MDGVSPRLRNLRDDFPGLCDLARCPEANALPECKPVPGVDAEELRGERNSPVQRLLQAVVLCLSKQRIVAIRHQRLQPEGMHCGDVCKHFFS